jgi:hypothetical protein
MRNASKIPKAIAQKSEILTSLARLMLAAPQKFLKIVVDVRGSGGVMCARNENHNHQPTKNMRIKYIVEDYHWCETDQYGSESSTGFNNTKSFIPFGSEELRDAYVSAHRPSNIAIRAVDSDRVLEYHDLDDESAIADCKPDEWDADDDSGDWMSPEMWEDVNQNRSLMVADCCMYLPNRAPVSELDGNLLPV